jgi:hypothetical protein
MSLYDEFLAFEATECPWMKDKFSEILSMDLTMLEAKYVMNLTSCFSFLRDTREKLSLDRNNMDVYRNGFVHIYNICYVLLKLGINIPKVSFPPDIQDYLDIQLVMTQ